MAEPASVVVQIKGANGSGKTTIIKQLIALSNDMFHVLDERQKPYATILYDLQWAILGHYPDTSAMGGCDSIHTVQRTKDILLELLDAYPGYWIVFEGMMISTTMTMYHYMLELKELRGIDPAVVVLQSSVDGCLKRIEQRRGSPLENGELVAQKCALVMRHQYQPGDVVYLNVDEISKDRMLEAFLTSIGDADLLQNHMGIAVAA